MNGSSALQRALVPFFALAFLITWGLAAAIIFFTAEVEAVFGTITGTNPVFVLAVYGPAIAALILVWRHLGGAGVASYLRRLTLWRMPAGWWLFLLLAHPVLSYVGASIKGDPQPFPFAPWYGVLPAAAAALLIGPVEELGWRGFAQPLLQRRMAPFWGGLLLGVIWALWHIPAFLMSGSPQHSWSFAVFFLGVVAMAVVMTPMFNASRGSILVVALFHFQANNPAWPDGRPWDSIGFLLVAIVVVWLNRRTLFSREGAVTDVLMPGAGGAAAGAPQ